MLVIRKQQMEVLEIAARKGFEDRMYRHLLEYFPHHCTLLGEDQMRLVIRYGWEKANSYEWTAECCVRSYIEFMCLLGGGFDTDTLLPWAAEILNDRSSDQISRGDRLYYKMWDYLDHAARDYRDGNRQPTTARFMNDLRQLRHGGEEVVPSSGLPQFLESLEGRIRRLFSAKCGYVGERNLREAIGVAAQSAGGYGITTERGLTLFMTMRFVLGGGFDRDLLLPWVSATLKDPETPDQYKRVDKLYLAAVRFLNRWWEVSALPGGPADVLG
jgi:hypothetical protein